MVIAEASAAGAYSSVPDAGIASNARGGSPRTMFQNANGPPGAYRRAEVGSSKGLRVFELALPTTKSAKRKTSLRSCALSAWEAAA